MSFAGTENLTSKGCDMLPLLLSRLSPNGNENKRSRTTFNTGCSPVLPELDLSEMRHDHSNKRELTTSEFELFQSRELSRWFGATRDMLDWPDFASYNYFSKFDAKTIPHSEVVDHCQASYRVKDTSLLKQIGSPVHLNYEGYGYSDWYYHHEEPEKFCLRDESPRREAETLLLDWDFDKEKDEPETAIITASSSEHITHSQVVTPSLLPDHSLHVCALPFHLTTLPRELNSSPSSSLYNEDHGNGVSYFLDDLQYTPDKCFGEKRNLDYDAFLLPVVLNVSEWNILTATGFPWHEHFSQHCYRSRYGTEPEKAWNMGCLNSRRIDFQEASESHELPSCNFQTSFDGKIGHPLLLEDSTGAKSDNEPFIGEFG
ncbi:unnamed protein product [Cuscuta campestris]|uniref:Uncharacterized protein n=1 Tax=Cuscuta campestris TaxID=132261 RepID=A0A484NGN8_9ASTE|nr:unnamed protein product [Cuscuta campestris]